MKKFLGFMLLAVSLTAMLLMLSSCDGSCYHTYDEETAELLEEPTCTENGKLRYTCPDCGQTVIEYPDELGHDIRKEVIRDATCTQTGVVRSSCSRCDYLSEDIIEAGHIETPNGGSHRYPTCQEEGLQIGTHCSRCEVELRPNEVLAKVPCQYNDNDLCIYCNAEKTYTISFYNGETLVETITYTKAGKGNVTPPAVPALEGNSGSWESYTLCSAAEITVNAVYKPLEFSFILETNGADFKRTEFKYTYGNEAEFPLPQKTGYTFLGWFKGTNAETDLKFIDAEGALVVDTALLSSTTLHPLYEPKKCTVKFETSGGTAIEDQIYSYDELLVLPTIPVREKDVFIGWFDANDVEYKADTKITDDVTLFAKWSENNAISTAEQFLAMQPDKSYYLTADINLGGAVWTPLENFTGALDGAKEDGSGNYTVYNFTLSTNAKSHFGLVRTNSGIIRNINFKDFNFNATLEPSGTLNFGVVAGINNGTIENVHLTSAVVMVNTDSHAARTSFEYRFSMGQIAGRNSGTIDNCSSDVNMSFNPKTRNHEGYNGYWGGDEYLRTIHFVGGIAGISSGTIKNSSYNGTVTSTMYSSRAGDRTDTVVNSVYLGGILGYNEGSGTVESCFSTLHYTASSNNEGSCHNQVRAGGLIGGHDSGRILTSYANGSITVQINSDCHIGGFVGVVSTNASIASCYANLDVLTKNNSNIGGFVGTNNGIVQNSYSSGAVQSTGSSAAGGFVGSLPNSGTISKSYATGDVSSAANANVGFFVGSASGVVSYCYFVDTATVSAAGSYITRSTEYETIQAIVISKLWSEGFLVDELYWEQEGWLITTDENPLLSWELEVGHSFKTETFDPTCQYGGFTVYNCEDCGRLFVTDFVDPIPHAFGNSEIVPPTCKGEGYTLEVCTYDDCTEERKTNILPATGHLEENLSPKEEVPASCTEDGYRLLHCNACENDVRETLEKLGHNGEKSRTERDASCTETGIDVWHCERCNTDYNVEIEKLPHTHEQIPYQAPTCGIELDGNNNIIGRNPVDGYYTYTKCSVCDELITEKKIIPAHSIANTELLDKLEPESCTEDGLGSFKCPECEGEFELTIPATGHTDTDRDNICDTCSQFTFTSISASGFLPITTVDELKAIKNNLGGNFILEADLDLTGIAWEPIGTFTGNFFGNGHKITGLSASFANTDGLVYFGIFSHNKGTIASLTVEGMNVQVSNASAVIGGIAAINEGKILGCKITGSSNFDVSVSLTVNDYAEHRLSHNVVIGGVVGQNSTLGTVENCASEGSISASFTNLCKITSGNILHNIWALVHKTYAETEQTISFGGIVGRNAGTVKGAAASAIIDARVHFTLELKYLKGKAFANSYIYGGSIVGYNTGTLKDSSAKTMHFGVVEYQSCLNTYEHIRGKLYEYGKSLMLYTAADGFYGESVGKVENLSPIA